MADRMTVKELTDNVTHNATGKQVMRMTIPKVGKFGRAVGGYGAGSPRNLPNTIDYTTSDNKRYIRFFATDILCFNENNGDVTINTGHWNSPTTIKRINMFLPMGYYVNIKAGKVVLTKRDGSPEAFDSTITFNRG